MLPKKNPEMMTSKRAVKEVAEGVRRVTPLLELMISLTWTKLSHR